MESPFIPNHIQNLKPYLAGKNLDKTKIVKLASNENSLGPSPKALEAVQIALKNSFRYPDPRAIKLVSKLAQKYKIQPSQILCASGTDAILSYIIMAFTHQPQDEILTSEGTFIGIYVNTLKQNRSLKRVALHDFQLDLTGLLQQISKNTKIIYLANPNNPTGSMFTKKEFEDFMKHVPPYVLVILDEAYEVYASSNPTYPNGLTYDMPNLITTRTFSKVYGLAGFRVGWAYGPQRLISELYKVKLPFEPSHIAQVAACAALEDQAFLDETQKLNTASLKLFQRCFQNLGITTLETTSNFLLLHLGSHQKAATFTQKCLDQGLILRHTDAFGIPEGVRINSGTLEETQFAIEIISKVYPTL